MCSDLIANNASTEHQQPRQSCQGGVGEDDAHRFAVPYRINCRVCRAVVLYSTVVRNEDPHAGIRRSTSSGLGPASGGSHPLTLTHNSASKDQHPPEVDILYCTVLYSRNSVDSASETKVGTKQHCIAMSCCLQLSSVQLSLGRSAKTRRKKDHALISWCDSAVHFFPGWLYSTLCIACIGDIQPSPMWIL